MSRGGSSTHARQQGSLHGVDPCDIVDPIPEGLPRCGAIKPSSPFHSKVSACCSTLQALALDILYYVPDMHESTLRTLVLLCLSPAYSPSLAQRAVGIVQHAAHAGRVAPDLYLSFLASLLVGRSSAVGDNLLDPGYTRAQQVVASASRAMASFPGSAGMPAFSKTSHLRFLSHISSSPCTA